MKIANRGILTLAGFLLFIFGFSALCLMIMGVQYSFLTWIDAPGRLFGFVVRLVMIILGFMLVAADRVNWGGEE
jgi:hypothetical protein